ncbi:hypothetical protein IKE97_01425 [Candidatus Saccharibacteria bacterium]|nr:hypothetical protein [Candidatus Saccharibacteria bacterium]
MAKESKDNKNLIIGICAAVAAIVVVVVLVVVLAGNSGINDDYFKSDDTKYVFSMETGATSTEDSPQPVKAHEVYTYQDDKITSLKTYYEFTDADAAKKAYEKAGDDYEKAGDENDDSFESMELNGKYIVLTAKAEQYENLTASEVKSNIELMEQLQNSNTDDTDEDTEETENEEKEEEE